MEQIKNAFKEVITKISYSLFIIKKIFKGDVIYMVLVYVTALQRGLITFSKGVPAPMKQKVADMLIAMDIAFLIDDPAYLPKTEPQA
jgi:hypothetical protein